MRSLLDWLRQEPTLKLVALGIAVFLWAWRSSETNPNERREFHGLPVRWENPGKDLTVVNQPPRVDVVLYGPRRTLDRLQAENQVQPVVDLSGIDQPAWRSLEIDVPVPDNVDVRSLEPERWEVEIDRYETDLKSIRADVGDTAPPEGYLFEPPRLALETVEVRGPQKRVNRVAYVAAEIDLSGRTASFEDQAWLRPVDSTGQTVEDIETTRKTVGYTVGIAKIEATQRMRVVVPIDSKPADGYEVKGTEVEPPTAVINGTRSGLKQVGEALTTVPVDVSGKTQGFTREVPLVLPRGVVAEPEAVRVRVLIGPSAAAD